jgi:hypothetical protein
MPKTLAQLIFFTILVLTSSARQNICHAETRQYRSEKHDITLHYPKTFEPVKIDHPLVILALRDKKNGFPTVNVIAQPGSSNLNQKGPNSPKNQIIGGYSLVGINNLKFLGEKIIMEGQSPYYIADLSYQDSDTKLKSSVALFSAVDQHFFVTFIDHEETFGANYPLFSSICKSVSLNENDYREGTETTQPATRLYWYLLLSIVLIIGYLIYRRYRRLLMNNAGYLPPNFS